MTALSLEEIDKQLGALTAEREALATKIDELRRQRPQESVENYTLHRSTGEEVTLSDLFGDKKDLLVIHNMGTGCVSCTLWADGFNGLTAHLENRSAFVVVSPNPPEVQSRFATERGWTFKMASAQGSSFTKDMGFEPEPGDVWPGVSAFRKLDDGSIVRTGRDYLGPGDAYCSVWHLFGLLADGVNDWEPEYNYPDE
jgi:predicted dithiol-disulfide oxidoreductase (DUF899 family)